jgi:crotonobetaine/carnitine-CoA ligase
LFEDGSEWSYAECRSIVRATAAALQSLGVCQGDRVLAWLPNSTDIVRVWFAANYLGAVFVPLNTAYRGGVLEHAVNLTQAKLMVAHPDLVERLNGLALDSLATVIVPGGDGEPSMDSLGVLPGSVLDGDASVLDDSAVIEPWDLQSIIYTSGTTGPSKGVLSPYLQLYTTAVVNYGYMEDGEAILVNFPMFHVGGTSPITIALIRGGSFYLVSGFSTTEFWNQVEQGNCSTTAGLIGAMAPFISRTKPSPGDADNPLRKLTMFPINEETIALGKRFAFDYVTGFNMTEVSTPLITDVNPDVHYSCGRPRTGVSCRLVDENDIEVAAGEPGELIVRADLPWTMNAGYVNMPEATATAWRNGWFHTGDVFRKSEAGEYFFVDRRKDTIRRRGENISSIEVETEVLRYEDVAEAVAVGVASEYTEEEVLVVVVPAEGVSIDPSVLTEFLVERLPYFMVPRYIRVVGEIPKTETNKPRKVVFRDAGITADTWDREAAGIKLKRERFKNGE